VANSTNCTATGGTVTLNGGSSPDGGTASILLTANQTGGYVQGNSGFTVSTVTDHTISFWYKDGTGTATSIRIEGVLSGGGRGFFVFNDLNDGTNVFKGSTHTDSYGIQVFPNGWKRFYMGYNSTSGTNATGSFVFRIRINGIQDTQTCYLFGLQAETGLYPTSYIPTAGSTVTRSADVSTSSTVTRAADVASITGSNFSSWYNQSEGTVLFSSRPISLTSNNGQNGSSVFINSDNNNFLALSNDPRSGGGGRAGVFSGGIDQYNSNLMGSGISNRSIALAYKANDFSASTQGLTVVTDNSGTLPAPNKINIGVYPPTTPDFFANGTISRLTYYPTRLSNALLQKLTK
jgi:hypothetical protein